MVVELWGLVLLSISPCGVAIRLLSKIIQDLKESILDQLAKQIRSSLKLFIEEDLITPEQAKEALNKITLTTDLAELADKSDFVTETIVEILPDKQKIFQDLDRLCPPHTIFVSNTSSFVVSEIGIGVGRQDKIGLTHYFAPPHIVPGVEVAGTPDTSENTHEIIDSLMKATNRIPIRVKKEIPGYLINRIQAAMEQEALQL